MNLGPLTTTGKSAFEEDAVEEDVEELDDADIDELFLWNTLLKDCCPTVIQLVVFASFYQGEAHNVNGHDRGEGEGEGGRVSKYFTWVGNRLDEEATFDRKKHSGDDFLRWFSMDIGGWGGVLIVSASMESMYRNKQIKRKERNLQKSSKKQSKRKRHLYTVSMSLLYKLDSKNRPIYLLLLRFQSWQNTRS